MKTKLGLTFRFISCCTVVSLLLTFLMVAGGWSESIKGAARKPIAEPSEKQKELREIFKDPNYPKLREQFEEKLRKTFLHEGYGDKFRDPERDLTDFIRWYHELSRNKGSVSGQDNQRRLERPKSDRSAGSVLRAMLGRTQRNQDPSPSDLKLFAKSFFEYYDEEGLSDSLIVNLRQEKDKIYVDLYHKSLREGKAYAYDTVNDLQLSIHKDVKEMLGQENATTILVTGDSPQECTYKEIFKSLSLPVIRTFATEPHGISQLGPRLQALRKMRLQMKGENTVVLNGLPTDEAGLKKLGKDVGKLELWQAADSAIRKVIEQRNSVILDANEVNFRDVLLRNSGKNVVFIVVDTKGDSIQFPNGSSVSAKNIEGWEERSTDGADPPTVVFIACNTASAGRGQPGQIVKALQLKGYISGAYVTDGFIRPDRAKDIVDELLRDKEQSEEINFFDLNDKLKELLPSAQRLLQKTTEGV